LVTLPEYLGGETACFEKNLNYVPKNLSRDPPLTKKKELNLQKKEKERNLQTKKKKKLFFQHSIPRICFFKFSFTKQLFKKNGIPIKLLKYNCMYCKIQKKWSLNKFLNELKMILLQKKRREIHQREFSSQKTDALSPKNQHQDSKMKINQRNHFKFLFIVQVQLQRLDVVLFSRSHFILFDSI